MRCVIVARHFVLRCHGQGTVPSPSSLPYLAHFSLVWHVLGVYGTSSTPSHNTLSTRIVKTTTPPSTSPCWSLLHFALLSTVLHISRDPPDGSSPKHSRSLALDRTFPVLAHTPGSEHGRVFCTSFITSLFPHAVRILHSHGSVLISSSASSFSVFLIVFGSPQL